MDTLNESYKHGSSPMSPSSHAEHMKTFLFGYPIAHSYAPLLHATLFADAGLPWTYELVESKDKNDFLPRLLASDCIGSAVTMPHKVTFIEEVDELTDEGRDIGAINTVFKRKDAKGKIKLVGTNTDCVGVRDAFLLNSPGVLTFSTGKPAMVLGGGGAGRSVVYALWKWMGASEIYIVNRYKHEADGIIEHFRKIGCNIVRYVATPEEAERLPAPALIVGAIPDFAPKEACEVTAAAVKTTFLEKAEKGVLIEMCYHPKPLTRLYDEATAAGWQVILGTEPMIYQGIAQQSLWAEYALDKFDAARATEVINERLAHEH
ncbi:NAD-P-binding protein [Limtongia smithiae]|uniref:NAD-P-binding protein n=1 Tax=Limtongia smithiae TaxID=1125753 RepID=UPI0034CDC2B9